jgi:hypothetical protein
MVAEPEIDRDTEDKEAAENLQRILDEMDVENSEDEVAATCSIRSASQISTAQDEKKFTMALPTTAPAPHSGGEPSLSLTEDILDLPSVPNFIPAESPRHITEQHETPWIGDGNVEPSWCCICNDDAIIKCLDCDGESLYCNQCWLEMHLREGGFGERRHRRVQFQKQKGRD